MNVKKAWKGLWSHKDPRHNHDFSQDERVKGVESRLRNKELRERQHEIDMMKLDRQAAFEEAKLARAERLMELELRADMAEIQPQAQQGGGDAVGEMFQMALLKSMTGGAQAPQTSQAPQPELVSQAVEIPQLKSYTDAELNTVKDTLPKRVVKALLKKDESEQIELIRGRLPDADPNSLARALVMLNA